MLAILSCQKNINKSLLPQNKEVFSGLDQTRTKLDRRSWETRLSTRVFNFHKVHKRVVKLAERVCKSLHHLPVKRAESTREFTQSACQTSENCRTGSNSMRAYEFMLKWEWEFELPSTFLLVLPGLKIGAPNDGIFHVKEELIPWNFYSLFTWLSEFHWPKLRTLLRSHLFFLVPFYFLLSFSFSSLLLTVKWSAFLARAPKNSRSSPLSVF